MEPLDESSLAAIPPPVSAAASASALAASGAEGRKDGVGKSAAEAAAAAFVENINAQLKEAATKLRNARLTAFARAFE